jgi:DNA-directed RNA polymerase subunit beta
MGISQNKEQSKERLNLMKNKLVELNVNLIEAQLNSYQDFLEAGIMETFDEINPILDYTGESWELRFEDVEWGVPTLTMRQAQKLGLSYDRPLYINCKLINKKTGEIKKQKIFVSDIPLMNNRGSFVVNGNERVVVMQVVRAEGVLFIEGKAAGQAPNFAVKLMPLRGKWFDFEMNKNGVMMIKLLDKRPKILLTTLLRALGYSTNEAIHKLLDTVDSGDISFVERTLKKDPTTNQGTTEI